MAKVDGNLAAKPEKMVTVRYSTKNWPAPPKELPFKGTRPDADYEDAVRYAIAQRQNVRRRGNIVEYQVPLTQWKEAQEFKLALPVEERVKPRRAARQERRTQRPHGK